MFKKPAQANLTQEELLLKKFYSARSNLLLAIFLTIVNIVLYYTGDDAMLLFSMSVPYYAVIFSDLMSLGSVGIIIAVVVLALYFVSWFLSGKRPGWLSLALVLFICDTLSMVGLYILVGDFSGFLDALIHIWVLYYLISGLIAIKKLKNLEVGPEIVDSTAAFEE